MILLAFDVDGTLDCSSGPVPVALVETLALAGYGVAIVSPSGAYPGLNVRRFAEGSREDNLRRAAAHFSEARVRLYVSDNGDVDAAHAAGFAYVDRLEFAVGAR